MVRGHEDKGHRNTKKLVSTLALASTVALGTTATGLFMPMQTASAATNNCRFTNLHRGDSGYCVRMAQTLLKGPFTVNTGGFTANLAIDSSYGPATQAAAYKWQRVQGLKYDGVVGPQTWKSLCGFGVGGGASNTTPETRARFNAAFVATC